MLIGIDLREFGIALAAICRDLNEPEYTLSLIENVDNLVLLYAASGAESLRKTLTSGLAVWRSDVERKARLVKEILGVDINPVKNNSRN